MHKVYKDEQKVLSLLPSGKFMEGMKGKVYSKCPKCGHTELVNPFISKKKIDHHFVHDIESRQFDGKRFDLFYQSRYKYKINKRKKMLKTLGCKIRTIEYKGKHRLYVYRG
jgi:hypothetical protein